MANKFRDLLENTAPRERAPYLSSEEEADLSKYGQYFTGGSFNPSAGVQAAASDSAAAMIDSPDMAEADEPTPEIEQPKTYEQRLAEAQDAAREQRALAMYLRGSEQIGRAIGGTQVPQEQLNFYDKLASDAKYKVSDVKELEKARKEEEKAAKEAKALEEKKASDKERKDPNSEISKQSQEAYKKLLSSTLGADFDFSGLSHEQIEQKFGSISNLLVSRQKRESDEKRYKEKSRQQAELRAEKASKEKVAESKGKQLPPNQLIALSEGRSVLNSLPDITDTISNNSDMFGPVQGRIVENNPYDTKAQTINSQMRATSQSFGRFMEGGVLRKEDEEKYRKMFPKLGDTPEVAKNKLQVVKRLLEQRAASDRDILDKSGYDVSGVPEIGQTEVPRIIAGEKQPGDKVRMRTPDGKVRLIPNDKVDEAKKMGAVEVE